MQALVTEHKPLTADRAEGFEASCVGVPPHLDLVFAVGTVFRDGIRSVGVSRLIR